jgi:hypothetical protein
MLFRRAKHARSQDETASETPATSQAQPGQPSPGGLDVVLGAFNTAGEPVTEPLSGEHEPPAPAPIPGETVTESAPGPQPPWFTRARLGFRRWRRTRPFWAGVWCILGGVIMMYGPLTAIKLLLVSGTVVWAGILIGALVVTMGLFMWFSPQFHQVLGILAALFSIVSLVTSNLGGFLIGLLFGVIGGSMAFAWTPLPVKAEQAMVPAVAPQPPQPGPDEQAGPAESREAEGPPASQPPVNTTGTRSPESTEDRPSPSPASGEQPMASTRE